MFDFFQQRDLELQLEKEREGEAAKRKAVVDSNNGKFVVLDVHGGYSGGMWGFLLVIAQGQSDYVRISMCSSLPVVKGDIIDVDVRGTENNFYIRSVEFDYVK